MTRNEATEERRFPMELRSQTGRKMIGRLLTYNREYDIGEFTEAYQPGCFRKSISEAARHMPLMIEHGHKKIPVATTVQWQDDEESLHAVYEFDVRSEAVEASRLAERGFLRGLSVGFLPIRTDWASRSDGRQHASRREARMIETSLCSLPVLEDAGVIAVRSMGPGTMSTPQLDAARKWLDSIRTK